MLKRCLGIFLILLCLPLCSGGLMAQENANRVTTLVQTGLSLGEAVMCEGIKDYAPVNKAIVFSLEIGKIYCFTSFEHVPKKMMIYHNWYRNDRLVTTKRLSLQPPKWSTFSSIQLREADKGPWRLEIMDQTKKLLRIVKFSVTD
jgi:DUF2914 family protein